MFFNIYIIEYLRFKAGKKTYIYKFRRKRKNNMKLDINKKNKMKEQLYNEELLKYGRELSQEEITLIEKIKGIDKKFNERLFLKMSHNIAQELIKTKIVRKKSAKYLYQAINKGVIKIDCPNYYSFRENEKYHTLKLRVQLIVKEHTIDYNDERIDYVGNKENLVVTYEMNFIKDNYEFKVKKCPRCGAPLKANVLSVCKYCFKFIDREESRKKRESGITKISYDIPIIKLEKIMPTNCINCGGELKKELKGFCEYCKNNNNPLENEWVLVTFEEVNEI